MITVSVAVLLIAGVVNCFLLRPTQVFKRREMLQWSALIALKCLFFLLFSPLCGVLLTSLGLDYTSLRPNINVTLVVLTLIVSASAKQIRETAASKGDS